MPRKESSVLVEETINNLRRLFQVVNEQSKTVAEETGLTGSQLWALKVLFDDSEHQVTVSSLARRMCLNSSTVVRLLDGLEQKDFVQRKRSGSDRRIVYISLKPKGYYLMKGSPEVGENILVRGLKMLSENKLHSIASGITQLVNVLEGSKMESLDPVNSRRSV